MDKKVSDLHEAIAAISSLLESPLMSSMTRAQLELFKADLENELRIQLNNQTDVAGAN